MSAPNKSGDGGERKKKESILDLSRYWRSKLNKNKEYFLKYFYDLTELISLLLRFIDKQIRVKFAGGRESSGTLKGFDPLLNIVLDDTIEYLRDPDDPYKLTQDTRHLGLVVCRGTAVTLICPMDGMESIANPFVSQD